MSLGVPGYAEEEPVGSGGFATVYKARQLSVPRTVAIKLLHADDLTDGALNRFQKESQAMGLLSWHPNIVTIIEAGVTADHRPFLVMEYLPDGSLGDLLAEGPLDWQAVTSIGVKLAGALAASHDEGLLHRDVKPANVLRTRYGEPMLADFGIVRIDGGTRTHTGALVASIAYSAPEVLHGQPATVLSDVYALGATMHALLGGEPPFFDETDETFWPLINRIASDPVPDLRPVGVPNELVEIIEGALSKSPDDRPQSAAVMGTRLQQVQRHFGIVPTAMILPEGVEAGAGHASEPFEPPAENVVTPIAAAPVADDAATFHVPAPVPPAPAPATAPAPAAAPAPPLPVPPQADEKQPWRLIAILGAISLAMGGAIGLFIVTNQDDTTTTADDVTTATVASVVETTSPSTTAVETTTTAPTPTTTSPPPTSSTSVERSVTLLVDVAKLRDEPRLSAAEVATINDLGGSTIIAIGEPINGWYEVQVGFFQGWMFGAFILPPAEGFRVAQTLSGNPAVLLDEFGRSLSRDNASGSYVLVIDDSGFLWAVLLADGDIAFVDPASMRILS